MYCIMSTATPYETMKLPSDQDATGRTLGEEEIELVATALRSGTLTSTKGNFVKTLETEFARLYDVPHAHACASGSAAVHLAVAAINPEPGDEIVTTSITDMGALTPILYQAAVPVFADVDPHTYNITAEAIERVLSPRTKAIIVTHLFGNPCDMTSIMALAKSRGLPVIEDCAQAFLARHRGQLVGTFGDIGCFSLQQGKHITTGEGGLVIARDAALARHMYLYINKAWGYGDPKPDHYFLALNYRMTELQGAVAVAQLGKLDFAATQRADLAARLSAELADIPGVALPAVAEHDHCTFWKYCLHIDSQQLPGGAVAVAARLKPRGIACAPRYIQKPAFQCEIFRDQRTFGASRFPFTLARPEAVDYSPERFPGTFAALEGVLVLPWTERYTAEHVDFLARSIRDAVEEVRQASAA
jgi:dTDP-4-amino-4,6-dideoxygalactose transaminase